ncbi:MAG: aminodeoxychorismate/anthranilate synthase component II [bacterium]|nr:aminodeoxychorismate/anthranilate synthase component II [bacterium]
MILLIDNYDSFTFNLYQQIAGMGPEVQVVRNDHMDAQALIALNPQAVVVSPGPGRPQNAGCLMEYLEQLPGHMPLLGVCLGHQALVESEGGRLQLERRPMHGKSSLVHHESSQLLEGLSNPFPAARYHSLVAGRDQLPDSLRLVAWTEEGTIMAVEHRSLPRFGVQFHPESILTPLGDRILANFLALSGQACEVR